MDVKKIIREIVLHNMDATFFDSDPVCGNNLRDKLLLSIDDGSIFQGRDLSKYENATAPGIDEDRILKSILYNQHPVRNNLPPINSMMIGLETTIVNDVTNYTYELDLTGFPTENVLFQWQIVTPDTTIVYPIPVNDLSGTLKTTTITYQFLNPDRYQISCRFQIFIAGRTDPIQATINKFVNVVEE